MSLGARVINDCESPCGWGDGTQFFWESDTYLLRNPSLQFLLQAFNMFLKYTATLMFGLHFIFRIKNVLIEYQLFAMTWYRSNRFIYTKVYIQGTTQTYHQIDLNNRESLVKVEKSNKRDQLGLGRCTVFSLFLLCFLFGYCELCLFYS